MKSITKKAYGKVNLLLKVGKIREDGKHEVLTVLHKAHIFDTVTVSETESSGIAIQCNDVSVPQNKENLAYRAAELYFEKAGLLPKIKISIDKKIPVTAGMAGGSSDAGATLLALDEMYGAVRFEEMLKIASHLGSDVPFFIYPDRTMLGKGSGDILFPFPFVKNEIYGLFVVDGIKKSTAEAYRLLDKAKENTEKKELYGCEEKLNLAIENGNLNDVLRAIENDFELSDKHSEKIISLLNGLGCERAFLCGSGPTVCGLFTDIEKTRIASEKITLKHFICRVN